MTIFGQQFIQVGVGRCVAKNTASSITLGTAPAPVTWTAESTKHPAFDPSTGVITFDQDCLFASTFFATIGTSTNTSYWTDAEISVDGGVTWVRGTDSARRRFIRSNDGLVTESFPFAGGFSAGQKLRFVDWAEASGITLQTSSNQGSTTPARRLTFCLIPCSFEIE